MMCLFCKIASKLKHKRIKRLSLDLDLLYCHAGNLPRISADAASFKAFKTKKKEGIVPSHIKERATAKHQMHIYRHDDMKAPDVCRLLLHVVDARKMCFFEWRRKTPFIAAKTSSVDAKTTAKTPSGC